MALFLRNQFANERKLEINYMMTPQLQCFMKLSTRHVTKNGRSFTTIADRINARDSLKLIFN